VREQITVIFFKQGVIYRAAKNRECMFGHTSTNSADAEIQGSSGGVARDSLRAAARLSLQMYHTATIRPAHSHSSQIWQFARDSSASALRGAPAAGYPKVYKIETDPFEQLNVGGLYIGWWVQFLR
jgi:hypothetical protein